MKARVVRLQKVQGWVKANAKSASNRWKPDESNAKMDFFQVKRPERPRLRDVPWPETTLRMVPNSLDVKSVRSYL